MRLEVNMQALKTQYERDLQAREEAGGEKRDVKNWFHEIFIYYIKEICITITQIIIFSSKQTGYDQTIARPRSRIRWGTQTKNRCHDHQKGKTKFNFTKKNLYILISQLLFFRQKEIGRWH